MENQSRRMFSNLPSWLDHFNSHDLKVLFRCSVAAWVASLLMFIGPSHQTIGTATFFCCLVLFMIPPSGIVFIFVLGSLTLLIGMALAWAWGVIAMKAAMAARPDSDTNAKLYALLQQANSQANSTGQPVALVEQELIYDGWMLDTRVTVIYFVLICLFIYFMARLRAKNPKFTLVSVFGTIIADLFLAFGPLLPTFNGTLPKTLIEPSAIGIGLGLASSFLFFPQSTSHAVLLSMQSLVNLAKAPIDFTAASLAKDADDVKLEHLIKTKAQTIAAYKAIDPAMGFLPLDFSRGRWGVDDVKSLKEPIRQTLIATLMLLDFHTTRLRRDSKIERLQNTPIQDRNEYADEKRPRSAGLRQLMESVELLKAIQSPESENLQTATVETLRQSSEEILPICQDAVGTAAECIHSINSRRWSLRLLKEQNDELLARSQKLLENLRSARSTFATNTTERLIETHGDIFDESGKLKPLDNLVSHSVRGIMIGMIYEESVLSVADALEQLLARIIALLEGRPNPRLWFPTGLRYAAAWVFRRTPVPSIPGQSTVVDPDVLEEQSKEGQRMLRISQGYRMKNRSGLGKFIIGTYHWFISAEGMYALRMVIVTIALAIPAVIPSSAGFYYREQGFWALIMGQTTLLVYMTDFTFSVICRAIGTVVGGVVGLIAWYIGSGHGPGNPYGLAAITAVVIIVFMWARLFFSPALLQASIMAAATCLLVIGYSYDDTQMPQYGNPGVGYNVFWRRLVLVIVGVVAALIVQVFPRPPSASRHIRKSLSNALRSLSDHYALLLSCWGHKNRETGLIAEKISLDLAEKLQTLDGPVALLRFEFSSSPFDSESLKQCQCLCHELNQNIGRLLFLSTSLPSELQDRLSRTSGLLDQRIVGEVMAVLGVVEQALKTGDALPEVLPTPLVKRSHEFWHSRNTDIGLEKDLIRKEDYRRFCVAVSSYLKVLAAVDELVIVCKQVLGEVHVVAREEVV